MANPYIQHAHRYETDPVPRPSGEREGCCACGAYRRYPPEPVIPGRASPVIKGLAFRLPFGAELGKRGGESTAAARRHLGG